MIQRYRKTTGEVDLEDVRLDITAPIWPVILDRVQSTSKFMKAFDTGCAVRGREYIVHILASKSFEEGRPIDNSM